MKRIYFFMLIALGVLFFLAWHYHQEHLKEAALVVEVVDPVEAEEQSAPHRIYEKMTPLLTNSNTLRGDLFKPVEDRAFGTQIIRVTDIATQPSRFLVARVQFWNSDASLIRLGHHKIFDAKSFDYLGKLPGRMYEVKWSHTNPDIIYALYHGFKKGAPKSRINPNNDFLFFEIDVRHGFKRRLIAIFPRSIYSDFKIGPWEGNIDLNDRYVVFSAKKVGSDHLVVILYDIQAQKEVAHKEFTQIQWSNQRGKNQHDWISISPLGNSILHAKSSAIPADFSTFTIEQYDLNFKPIRQLSPVSEHGDLGLDKEGKEVYVQFRNRENKHGIYAFSLDNNSVIPLLGDNSYGGGHISCQNYQRQGWCYVSTKGKNYREVFALKLDGSGEVEHFAQTHGIKGSSESSKGTPSPDGTQVLFESTWGVKNRTEAYIARRK